MRQQRYVFFVCFFIGQALAAQRILYSPIVNTRNVLRFNVAGKTGDYYWVQTEQPKKHISRQAADWMKEEQFFSIYDRHLQLVNRIAAATVTGSTLKKYMVCGNEFFDELVLSTSNNQTHIQLRRYTATGSLLTDSSVGFFPFTETGNSFILAVSADKSKNLLLGFESVHESAPKMHALLFDENWRILSSTVFEHPYITQPFMQDDFFCFPSAINNAAVQLTNNGEWLMALPSRISNNYLMLHFDGHSNNITRKEIILPSLYKMEDIAMCIDYEKSEASAGILSNYRQGVHKAVSVARYSFARNAFDFDSSYYFSTLPGNQIKKNNLTKEVFVAVPGTGFVFMKEYGRTYTDWFQQTSFTAPQLEAAALFTNINTATAHFSVNANGYSRYGGTGMLKNNYDRGDLSLFYFPAQSGDSCWTGLINKKQITELNAPALSYLFVSVQNRMMLMYNSVDRADYPSGDYPFGTTLSLDTRGNQLSERELISWKADQSLQFQQAAQISKNEVAVPYERDQQKGFAIISF